MIKILKNLGEYKSIICLDGDLPCDLIGKINLPIIAADGAANTLIRNGIEPNFIIGDLDSVDSDLLCGRSHLRIESQNSTDFEKALDYIEEESMTPAIVTGIDGGYIDHVLGNIGIFSRTRCVAVSRDMVSVIVEKEQNLEVPMNTKISIFGMPQCIVKSKGLRWELDGNELSISGKSSCSNRAVSEQVNLKISSGRAIVFVYTKVICDAGSACTR
ncbi:MAG: thiamine diphosphokinase [Holosporaceae bacterium]|jgi:thiamine pyrophosphokinase|nr:thiamine diphosphokinase [Holosporaceae bacterium]